MHHNLLYQSPVAESLDFGICDSAAIAFPSILCFPHAYGAYDHFPRLDSFG